MTDTGTPSETAERLVAAVRYYGPESPSLPYEFDRILARSRPGTDVERLAVAMNDAQIRPDEIALGHDLRVPAARIVAHLSDRCTCGGAIGSIIHADDCPAALPETDYGYLKVRGGDGS